MNNLSRFSGMIFVAIIIIYMTNIYFYFSLSQIETNTKDHNEETKEKINKFELVDKKLIDSTDKLTNLVESIEEKTDSFKEKVNKDIDELKSSIDSFKKNGDHGNSLKGKIKQHEESIDTQKRFLDVLMGKIENIENQIRNHTETLELIPQLYEYLDKEVKIVSKLTKNLKQSKKENKQQSNRKFVEYRDDVKLDGIREALKFAWDKYKEFAWGKDELKPIAKESKNWMGIGLTIFDAVDTLWIAGLKNEFHDAKEFVKNSNLEADYLADVFEMNIRILGGLLSCYTFTRDKVFLTKAQQFADILLHAWDKEVWPMPMLNLKTKERNYLPWTYGSVVLAEVGTIQLEFCTLSKLTRNATYCDKALKVIDKLEEIAQEGIYSTFIDYKSSTPHSMSTMGGLGDSFYEYLLKMWLITDKKIERFQRIYENAMDVVRNKMVKYSKPNNLLYLANLNPGTEFVSHSMEHLACFAGGMFAMGSIEGATPPVDFEIGENLTSTCHEMYIRQRTGISPESVTFNYEGSSDLKTDFQTASSYYILRPETFESYFYLWRFTHDQKYRDWGWEAFLAINKTCRGENGFFGISDVDAKNFEIKDNQESFFLAETLKYLYLLFTEDSYFDLKHWVFNTEAHPFPVWKDGVSWLKMFEDFNNDYSETAKNEDIGDILEDVLKDV